MNGLQEEFLQINANSDPSFNYHIGKVDYLKLDLPDAFVVSRNGKLTGEDTNLSF